MARTLNWSIFSREMSLIIPASALFALSLLLSGGKVLAQDREKSQRFEPASLGTSQVIRKDYFAFGPLVEISGTVDGDVYAFGGQILIDGRVGGDVLVAGGRVSISGNVAQDVRVVGGQVNLSGSVGKNVTVWGGNVELARSAEIRGSVVAAGGNIHIAAPVEGDAKVAAGSLIVSGRLGAIDAAVATLRITSRAEIDGDVNYFSQQEASVDEGARIHGKVVRKTPPELPLPSPEKFAAFFAGLGLFLLFVSFVSTLILGLLSVRFLPRYHQLAVTVLKERPWASLGIGFVAAVIIPVVCAILFAMILTTPIALILTTAYFILLYWGRIFVISRIGEAILGPRRVWAFLLGLIVYYLLALIPVIGWLMVLLAVLFGLGADLMARREFYVAARERDML